MKKCTKCKQLLSVDSFYKDKNKKTGLKEACKKCSNISTTNWRNKNKIKIKESSAAYYKSDYGKFIGLKNKAVRTKHQFKLTYDEYIEIIKENKCFYCNESLPEYGSGVDRINSNKGYVQNNCRPCCTMCNRMKSNYTESEFLSQMDKIIKNVAIKNQMK